MGKFWYKAALGGSFGGTDCADWVLSDANTYEDAEKEAYEEACQMYESYEGLYDVEEEYPEDDEYDEDEAWGTYCDQCESWLDYEVKEFPDGVDPNQE